MSLEWFSDFNLFEIFLLGNGSTPSIATMVRIRSIFGSATFAGWNRTSIRVQRSRLNLESQSNKCCRHMISSITTSRTLEWWSCGSNTYVDAFGFWKDFNAHKTFYFLDRLPTKPSQLIQNSLSTRYWNDVRSFLHRMGTLLQLW